MAPWEMNRREFIAAGAAGVGALTVGRAFAEGTAVLPEYNGPNVIVVRFGGGVRRQETIADPANTWCPYFLHKLVPRGTFFPRMEIAQLDGVDTSHGQGTLYVLTGKYRGFKNVSTNFLGERFEPVVPTLFEYLRKTYNVPPHQALIVNGEDRTDEEFYSFSNHHLFGVDYRSATLSLYRFKVHLLRRQIEAGKFDGDLLAKKQEELGKLEGIDHRVSRPQQAREIQAFWDRWAAFYGESGFVNPRGDRLLTELAVRALKELQPRMMMINYNDPDYVHWGVPSHYTQGIAIIDRGLERLVETVEADPHYRGNTIFAIVPDCGRDNSRLAAVPFQHHFNSKSSHEIFALLFGPGVEAGKVVDRTVDQTSLAATLGGLMKMPTEHAEGPALEEVFA